MRTSLEIKEFLAERVPQVKPILQDLDPVPRIRSRDVPIPEAVVRVVAGQMLSRAAAATIYRRLQSLAEEHTDSCTWLLSDSQLRYGGLSGRKAHAIRSFAETYSAEPLELEKWRHLGWEDLCNEVSKHRGMSEWTASILGIFYFGIEDIFPRKDGSIRRALTAIRTITGCSSLPIDQASPYRSYFAIYLWAALDTRRLEVPSR